MKNRFLKLCSLILTVVMLVNMLPMSVFAAEYREGVAASTETEAVADAYIVDELTEKRTKYSKEYILSNGVHMAAVYAVAVHFETENGWEEIDNTLVTHTDGTLTNTAGVWDIQFPQQLNRDTAVTIEKDGYTLSFFMAGELTEAPAVEISPLPMQPVEEVTMTAVATLPQEEAFAVTQVQSATAQVAPVTLEEQPEGLAPAPEKTLSRVQYADVYQDTHIAYDLDSNKLKESVILDSYRENLRGYQYTLQVGQLIPVAEADGSITLYDETENPVMVMPAPFLVDDAGVYSYDVSVELTEEAGTYTLTYLLPQAWLAAEERAWPVVLDPIINADLNINNIQDRTVTENISYSHTWGMNSCGYDTDTGAQRFYLKYVDLPVLTSADVILEASVHMYKSESSSTVTTVEARKVQGQWDVETITWANQPTLGGLIKDYAVVYKIGWYGWTVTDIVRDWYANGNTGMVFKASDNIENGTTRSFKQFLSSDYGTAENRPQLNIYFRNNNGLESYWDYTTASAGRAGTGSVNNLTGNLTFVRSDIGFGGNRMPVSISHVYNLNDVNDPDPSGKNNNANDTAGNFLGLGVGWRTNFHQEIYLWKIAGAGQGYYIWEDADGTDHYFYSKSSNTYVDEDGLELTLTTGGSGNTKYALTDKQGNTSYFDSGCRLYQQKNNQQTKSDITVTYCSNTSGAYNYYWIATVTDGIDRTYTFNYTNKLLSSIVCTGTNGQEIGRVSYTYNSSKHLTQITDRDGKSCTYTYDSTGHLLTATDIDGYKLSYTYYPANEAWQPYRIKTVTEYAGNTPGGSLTFTYAHNQTKIKDYNGNVQTLQFNDYGNLTAIQDDEGHAQYAQFATNSHTESGKGNQLTASSKLQNSVGGLLSDGSFERTILYWYRNNTAINLGFSTDEAYHGSKSMRLESNITQTKGAYSHGFTVGAGETVTFSAYVKGSGSYYLDLQYEYLENGQTRYKNIAEPDAFVNAGSSWERREITFKNPFNTPLKMWAFLQSKGAGEDGPATVLYMDQAQVELCAAASRYNLIDNGDFVYSGSPAYNWTGSGLTSGDGRISVTNTNRAAPTLDTNVFSVEGNPTGVKELKQTIAVGGEEGDCYVFSGWAWADSAVPNGAVTDSITAAWNRVEQVPDNVAFDITVKLHYNSTEHEEASAKFNPGSNTWQYTANAIVAKKAYTSITVTVRYNYNANTVWFDGIQLYKEQFGSSYTYDEDGNVISVVDLQKQRTDYEYDENGNVTAILQGNKAKLRYEYDTHNNVTKATTEEGLVYTFRYDKWGNNTSVSIVGEDGEEINSIAHYSPDGNRLLDVWDPLNRVTYYGYNEQTNELEWVQYPGDTEATRTKYDYDDQSGKLLSVTAAVAENSIMSVAYSYENDYLTAIQTPTTTYAFQYDIWGLRETVKIGNVTLATYHYHDETLNGGTDDRKNDLDALVYGNGDRIDYEYDDKGRLTKETYEDNATVDYTYDNNGNLATRVDSATGRTTHYYYDLTERMVKYEVTGENYYYSIGYTYDTLNNLTQLVENVNGEIHTTSCTYDDDNRITSFTNGITSKEYDYDVYGRVSQQTTKGSDGVWLIKDSYTYQDLRTREYTSTQISTHEIYTKGYYKQYAYTYDANGNITKITEGVGEDAPVVAEYTYDAANQLLTEVLPGQRKTVWTYDNAGNIQTRTEHTWTNGSWVAEPVVTYGYADEAWGDMLTSYNNQDFDYDDGGNLVQDGTWVYSWQHGRQLAAMEVPAEDVESPAEKWQFAYDANGLRSRRIHIANGSTTTWEYVYNDGQLVQMTKDDDDTLYFAYDAAGAPMTVTHKVGNTETTYYYATNLQGDIIAILDDNGELVVEYTYDAWGNPMGTILSENQPNAATLAELNPLRYRGYVYDTETALYYLQSRYYNPQIGRFLNADVYAATGQGFIGNNMFAYCNNNPGNAVDPSGEIPGWIIFAFIIGCGILGGIWGATSDESLSKNGRQDNADIPDPPPQDNVPILGRNQFKTQPPPTSNPSVTNPQTNENQTLTNRERVDNIVIGVTTGLMVGGAIVLLGGTILCVAGYSAIMIPMLGMTGSQIAAWGILAFNIFPMIIAPFLGNDTEPLEYPS